VGDSFSRRRERTTAVLVLEVSRPWSRSDRRRALFPMAVRVERAAVDEADGAGLASACLPWPSVSPARRERKTLWAEELAFEPTEGLLRLIIMAVRVVPGGDAAALLWVRVRRRELAAVAATVAAAIAVRVVLFRLRAFFFLSIFPLDIGWAIRPAGLTALQL
jgi:hypothetical protein